MRKFLFSVIAFASLSLTSCGGTGSKSSDSVPANAPAVEEQANNQEASALVANGLPVIVDFSAEWCPPCRQLKPIFADLKTEFEGKVDFVTVNVDSVPDLSREYNIESIPALIYLNEDGKEIYRSVGFQTADQIKADISKYFNN